MFAKSQISVLQEGAEVKLIKALQATSAILEYSSKTGTKKTLKLQPCCQEKTSSSIAVIWIQPEFIFPHGSLLNTQRCNCFELLALSLRVNKKQISGFQMALQKGRWLSSQ